MNNPKEVAIKLFKRMYTRIFHDKNFIKMDAEKMERRKAMFQEKFADDAKSLAIIAADTLIQNKEEKRKVEEAIKHVNVAVALSN